MIRRSLDFREHTEYLESISRSKTKERNDWTNCCQTLFEGSIFLTFFSYIFFCCKPCKNHRFIASFSSGVDLALHSFEILTVMCFVLMYVTSVN